MKFNRLSYQILAVFTAVIIICLGASGWLILQISENVIIKKTSEVDQQIARRIAREIEAEMASIEPVMKLIAESKGLRLMELADVKREIDLAIQSFPEITSIYVADIEGEQITKTGTEELENVSNIWSFQVAKGGEELISDIYPAPITSEPMRSITLPIVDKDTVVGVVSAEISFRKIMLSVLETKVGQNGSVVVVASNGRAVAHTFMEQLLELDLNESPAVEAVLAGQEGAILNYTDELGSQVLGSYAPISELGWGVVIQRPLTEINAEVRQLRITILLATIGSVVLAVFSGLLTSRQISKPIQELASASERIAQGDLSTPVEVRSSNEIGVLAHSFNQMTASLKKSKDELEHRIAAATKEISQRADDLETLYEVNQDLVAILDLEKLLPLIAKRVTTELDADRCAVFLFDEREGVLKSRTAHGYMAERLVDFSYQPGEEVIGQVYTTGKSQYVPDLEQAPDLPRHDEIRTALSVPLTSSTAGPFGVLSITSLRPNAFSPDKQQLLKTIAYQIATAIENARLYKKAVQHATELAVLHEVSKEITSTLELDTRLQIIAEEAVRLVESDKSLIILIDPENKRISRTAGHGFSQAEYENFTFEEFCDGINGWVLREKVPTLSDNIQEDERNRGKALDNARANRDKSAAVTPLLIRGEVIGTLTVINSRQKRLLTPADLEMVTMLAAQASTAIRNARLYERAQEADRLKSAFLASMSHELRTPLNSIIGFTGILLQGLVGPLNDEQTKQLGMVRGSARHLLSLINDVLDISKIEAGQLEVVSELFEMKAAIENAVQALTPLAEKKSLKLLARVDPEVRQIRSDRRRIEQILINLINNAIKFTDAGDIHIESKVCDNQVVTSVSDSGIGIKPDDINIIFNAFRQVDTGLTRQSEGTGLGLSVCRQLVKILGGEIWVESDWGVGSTFTFSLPLNEE